MELDQSNIGWEGIIEGTLGKHWSEEQNMYKTQDHDATSGQKWAHLVIRRLWKIAWDVWQHRNEAAHCNDTQALRDILLRQVQDEFDTGIAGIRELQPFLQIHTKDTVLRSNNQYLQSWLRSVKARRTRDIRKQTTSTEFDQMRQTLRQFLIR